MEMATSRFMSNNEESVAGAFEAAPMLIQFSPELSAEVSELAQREQLSIPQLLRKALGRERVLAEIRDEGGRAMVEDQRGVVRVLL